MCDAEQRTPSFKADMTCGERSASASQGGSPRGSLAGPLWPLLVGAVWFFSLFWIGRLRAIAGFASGVSMAGKLVAYGIVVGLVIVLAVGKCRRTIGGSRRKLSIAWLGGLFVAATAFAVTWADDYILFTALFLALYLVDRLIHLLCWCWYRLVRRHSNVH